MITFFTSSKAFQGKDAIHQYNAIKSWTLLKPRPEILLIGGEEGSAEICKELGVIFIPEVKRNKIGRPLPLASDLFNIAQKKASYSLISYINADIILPPNFMDSVQRIINAIPDGRFLIYGGRWNTEINKLINFKNKRWYKELLARAKKTGWLDDKIAMDYYVIPKNINWDMPDSIFGVNAWESWIPWKAKKLGLPLINATNEISIIHPRHVHSYFQENEFRPLSQEEMHNLKVLGLWRRYTPLDATHRITGRGIEKIKNWKIKFLIQRAKELRLWIVYCLRGKFYRYSYPFYLVWIPLKKILKKN